MSAGILYVAYDGMLEPLGQSQVLAYLEKLSKERPIHLLSFEKPEDWVHADALKQMRKRIADAGIRWHPRRYHKRPTAIATSWDIAAGILAGLWLVLRYRLAVVHARSYVSAVIALALKRLTGVKFLFDMRGFWADERVDGGLWPRDGRMFRVAKWFEQRFLLRADHVVSLTQAGVRIMQGFPYLRSCLPPMTVIPTCADLSRFSPSSDVTKDGFVVGYVGSAGTWYLFDATVACFQQLLLMRPDARLLIINRNEHEYIRDRLSVAGIDESRFELKAAQHKEIPAEMAKMHAGIFFIKPVFSKQASAPTKLGEFLGCGVPCLANTGVGDMAEILKMENVGVAVDSFDNNALSLALEQLIQLTSEADISQRCTKAAQRHFSLEEGVARYESIYRAIILS
jgi:glycosyltransferase involved in cell wall biosynthesis